MKQGNGRREHQKRPVAQQRPNSAWPPLCIAFFLTARYVVIYGFGVDPKHGDDARNRKGGDHPEHRTRIDQRPGGACKDSSYNVAAMVERLIAPNAMGKLPPPHDAKADRGNCERENCVGGAGDGLRNRYRPKLRIDGHNDGRQSNGDRADGDKRPLPFHGIHQRAARASRDHGRDACDGKHNADLSGIPMLTGEKEYREEWPKTVLHIREKEIEPIERGAVGFNDLFAAFMPGARHHFLPFLFGQSGAAPTISIIVHRKMNVHAE